MKEHQPENSTPPNDDQLITSSGFYQHLASAAGYQTWDEAWDTLFEDPRADDFELYRKELATFCCAARATSDPKAELEEGTVERERHFLKVIRETLAKKKLKPEDAVVICGGFHLFMDRSDTALPPEPPKGTVYTTVIPYSFFRIAELTGYGAGNRAPQFYQTFYDLSSKRQADDIVLEHAIAVLRSMRKQNEPLSTADAIAITHHAEMLARLRNRGHATHDDIVDAIITCCCKGNPAEEGDKLLARDRQCQPRQRFGQSHPEARAIANRQRFPQSVERPRTGRGSRKRKEAQTQDRQTRSNGCPTLCVSASIALLEGAVRGDASSGGRL